MNHLQELVECRKLAQVLEKVVHRPRETEDAISGELLGLKFLHLLLFLVRHSGDELVQQHRDDYTGVGKFSKVSAPVQLLCETTMEGTFENVCCLWHILKSQRPCTVTRKGTREGTFQNVCPPSLHILKSQRLGTLPTSRHNGEHF